MDPQPAFTFQDLFTFVIGDMAKAIAEREGEPREQQFARSQAAVHMILGFLPRDVIEAMLAGHCVMLHEVMTAKARTSLRGDTDPSRRGPRSNIVGLNKAFNDNLDRLERYQQRPAEGTRDAPETQSPTAPAPPPTATTEPRQPPPVAPRLNRAAPSGRSRREPSRCDSVSCRAQSGRRNAAARSPDRAGYGVAGSWPLFPLTGGNGCLQREPRGDGCSAIRRRQRFRPRHGHCASV